MSQEMPWVPVCTHAYKLQSQGNPFYCLLVCDLRSPRWPGGNLIFQFSAYVTVYPGGNILPLEIKTYEAANLRADRMESKIFVSGLFDIIVRGATPTYTP